MRQPRFHGIDCPDLVNPTTPPPVARQEEFLLTDVARLHRWLPWLLVFRAFRVATHHRQWIVALLAVWLLVGGRYAIAWLAGSPLPVSPSWDHSGDLTLAPTSALSLAESLLNHSLLSPLGIAFQVTLKLLQPQASLAAFGLALLDWLWVAVVLIGTGGILSRIAALELTRFIECRISTATRYVQKYFAAYFGGILLAVLGIIFLTLLNASFGYLCNLPLAGPYLLWIGYPLALLCGLLIALLAIGLTLAWPLMICTASVEGTDPFDGLSRSLNYVFARPWYGLFLILLLGVYGWGLLYFVESLVALTESITATSLGRWLHDHSSLSLNWLNFWQQILHSIPNAFAISYFWTGMTIVYLLLRKAEDATSLEAVFLDDETAPQLPLVGIPAAAQREQQQPKVIPTNGS